MSLPQRFKLVFYVPPTALEACKTAVFAAGAGRYPGPGGYTECAFVSKGTGQFRPGDAAHPHVRDNPSYVYGEGRACVDEPVGWQCWRVGICGGDEGGDDMYWEGCRR
jgi:hypothetical protein